METFKYINREYTPSVDLTTLGKTFDTLEQGHQDAVKATSDLRTVVASLDMNEAEDDFKQSLLDEIETTIDNNTIYGNSYGALDDIITKSGDIASDGRVIGRLRNQAAKKEYDAKVDTMSIPDGMKEMYKEENPYYYVEGEINERTGKTAPGELWKPNTTPVKTIADADIQKYALQIAAKEAGGSQSISFLDANGRPTLDPSQSADGAMYKQVGTSYQKLPEDKIAKAYRVAIDSIPGAKDSLMQDYKYAEWNREKLVKQAEQNNGDTTPYVPGLTDRDGNVYTYDQWLNNKINNFTDVSAYNRVVTTIDFGTALQNYRTANPIGSGSGSGGKLIGSVNSGFGTVSVGYEKVEVDSFAGAQQAKIAAEQQALSVMKSIDNEKFGHYNNMSQLMTNLMLRYKTDEPYTIVRSIVDTYEENISDEDIIRLNNAIIGYNFANSQVTDMLDKSKDKDALLFSADVSSNAFTNNNKYSKQIIETLNNIYKDGKPASFTVGKSVLEELAKLYGKSNFNDLRKLGINIMNDGDYYIVDIPAEHRNELPRFYSILRKAENNVPGTFGSGLTHAFTSKPGKYNYKQNQSIAVNPDDNKSYNVIKLGFDYDKFVKKAAEAEKNAGVTDGYVTLESYDQGSFAALWYRENHVGTVAERKSLIEQAEARVDNMLGSGLIDAGLIKELDETGVTEIDVANNQHRRNLIQKMYTKPEFAKTVSRTCIIPNGVTPGQSKGYKLTFTVPKGADTGPYKEGDLVNFIISGILEEEINYDPSYNPTVLAGNAMHTSTITNSAIENIGYNSWLGDTRIVPTKDGYKTSMFGSEAVLEFEDAKNLIADLLTVQQIKANFRNNIYNTSEEGIEQLKNSVNELSIDIADILSLSPYDVGMMITNYLKNPD